MRDSRAISRLIATGGGSGYSPIAPGTVGTLVAIPLYFLTLYWLPSWLQWTVTVALFVIGMYVSDVMEDMLAATDPSVVVIDEIVAFFLILNVIPAHWGWLLLAFVLFRIADIVKPWPVSWLERRCYGGIGVMVDDIAAALYVIIVLWLLQLLL